MKSRKLVKRIRTTNNRILHKKNTPNSKLKTKLDAILDKENIPNRILLVGAPSTRSVGLTYIENRLGRPLFRVDIAAVVSKYNGETEKNLEKLFSKAERKDWILYFDEADALFEKRADFNDTHDKKANLEIAYLLQRMEKFKGMVVLATNLKGKDEIMNRLSIDETVVTDPNEEEKE